mmetsp:Transcript_53033/g.115180  ORF Transcript_53033/g.115180 Transcript_53033/m.115180 type:complete len:364 (-) Transcript_53033:30-1121(-)
MQKYVHNQLEEGRKIGTITTGATDGSPAYLSSSLWWLGLFLMLLGEIGNFTAFGFAPTSLISPLGAVTVVVNSVIATKMLKEPFGRSDVIGIALTVIGGVTFVSFAPAPKGNQVRLDVTQIAERLPSASFISFAVCIVAITICTIVFSRQRNNYYGEKYVWVYVLICSLLGAITVVTLKAFSGLLQLTFKGHQQFWVLGAQGFIPYGIMITFVLTGALQIRYLQMAMEQFGSSQVVPVYYVLFTFATMSGGAIVYHEFSFFSTITASVLFGFGLVSTVLGVWIISAKGRRLWWAPCLYSPGEYQARRRRSSVGSMESGDISLMLPSVRYDGEADNDPMVPGMAGKMPQHLAPVADITPDKEIV